MPLSPLHRVQLHCVGRFDPGGRGFTYAFSCWALTPQLPEYGHWRADGQPDCYTLPMDDAYEDWLRLEAEAWYRDHHADPDVGKPQWLVHSGGMPHPETRLAHIQLGGTLSWEQDPHPLVQQRLEWLRGLGFDGLVQHLCGPDPFRGVLQGAL